MYRIYGLKKCKAECTDVAYLLVNDINWGVTRCFLAARHKNFGATSRKTVMFGRDLVSDSGVACLSFLGGDAVF